MHGLTSVNLSASCRQHGSNLIGMTDLNVPEQLYQYMVGGHRRAHAGANREKHKSPSYQIKVTHPGQPHLATVPTILFCWIRLLQIRCLCPHLYLEISFNTN